MCINRLGFPVNFGGPCCRRPGYIALPSFIASMNSVGELLETILFRINIADTNELAEAVESWRGASGGALLPEGLGPIIVRKKLENMLCEVDQVSRATLLAMAQRESGAWPNVLTVLSLGTLLDPESLRV